MKKFLYHENGLRMIQAEELPVKPREPIDPENKSHNERPDYYLDLERYESEIAALKAKSIPVGNPITAVLGLPMGNRYSSDYTKLFKDGEFYEWPGDVEIKEEPEYPIDHTSYPPYRDVAYLKS